MGCITMFLIVQCVAAIITLLSRRLTTFAEKVLVVRFFQSTYMSHSKTGLAALLQRITCQIVLLDTLPILLILIDFGGRFFGGAGLNLITIFPQSPPSLKPREADPQSFLTNETLIDLYSVLQCVTQDFMSLTK